VAAVLKCPGITFFYYIIVCAFVMLAYFLLYLMYNLNHQSWQLCGGSNFLNVHTLITVVFAIVRSTFL